LPRQAQPFCRTESQHTPVHSGTAAVLKEAIKDKYCKYKGHAVAKLVEELRTPEGPGFGSRWCHGIFHDNSSGCTMALGWTQPLTEMTTRNIYWGVKVAGALG
jgi:hypothetical protein